MGINDVIPYEWDLGWDSSGMSNPKPVVNRLLKAMIERDAIEMWSLFKQGATLKGMNEETFKRVLYHVLDDHNVIKCLTDHGFTAFFGEYDNDYNCYDPDGYSWGLLARAWNLKNYAVFDLLASKGFKRLYYASGGTKYDTMQWIFERNDVLAMQILLENGYPREMLRREMKDYPNSKVTLFIQENPVIKRKSVGLDNYRFLTIPKPELEKAGLFNRKVIQGKNELLMQDYQERVSAQKRMMDSFTPEELKKLK